MKFVMSILTAGAKEKRMFFFSTKNFVFIFIKMCVFLHCIEMGEEEKRIFIFFFHRNTKIECLFRVLFISRSSINFSKFYEFQYIIYIFRLQGSGAREQRLHKHKVNKKIEEEEEKT